MALAMIRPEFTLASDIKLKKGAEILQFWKFHGLGNDYVYVDCFREPMPDDPAALAHRALREHSGGRILIVGHADTVPQLVAALSGNSKVPEIGADEYGTMYIVAVPRIGHANLLRLNY